MSLSGIKEASKFSNYFQCSLISSHCALLSWALCSQELPRWACAAMLLHVFLLFTCFFACFYCFSHQKILCPSLLLVSFQGFNWSFHLCNFPSPDNLTLLSPSIIPFSLFLFAYFSMPWHSSWSKAQEIIRHCSLNCLILN